MRLRALRGRIRTAGLASLAVFGVLSARLAWLQIAPTDAMAATALDNALRERRVVPPRGRILDRTGQVLADTRPTVDLVLRPADVEDADVLRERLAPYLDGHGQEQLDEALASRGLERHRPWVLVRDLDQATLAKLAARRHLLPGCDLSASHLRAYPAGPAASHVIGYVSEVTANDLLRLDGDRYRSGDQVGRRGLEWEEETHLAGLPGRSATLVDALGRPVDGEGPWFDALESERSSRQVPAMAGADVHLTLDSGLQQATYDALEERAGAAVMIDVHSGAVLAYVSSPNYDPGELVRGVTRSRWSELTNAAARPLLDRAARGLYPPASTFKIVTAAAALEHGISKDMTVDCRGGYQVGRRRFKCWKRGGHGVVDLKGALKGSCDVWFYVAGLELGPDALADAARRLGLGVPTGLGLNGERGGLLPTREYMRQKYGQEWTVGDTASASIGQGINLVTPIQLAAMTAAVANGGQLPTPWIVREVRTSEGATIEVGGRQAPRQTEFSTATLDAIRAGLTAVVMEDRGTAHSSSIAGLPYAGKTGTAQTVSAKLKAERPGPETEDHALFVAYAPLESPQIAVAVVLEHAGGGSANAAPVAKKMLTAWGLQQGILEPEPEEAD